MKSCSSPQFGSPQLMVTFLLHLKHTSPHGVGTMFLSAQHSPGGDPEAQTESENTGLHDLQMSLSLTERQGIPCFPHPLPGASLTCVHVQSHGAAVAVEGTKGKAVWSLLFVVSSFFPPKKPLKQASVEQLSQLQKCLEGGVVRGVWRREAGEINLTPTGKWTQTPAVCI